MVAESGREKTSTGNSLDFPRKGREENAFNECWSRGAKRHGERQPISIKKGGVWASDFFKGKKRGGSLTPSRKRGCVLKEKWRTE